MYGERVALIISKIKSKRKTLHAVRLKIKRYKRERQKKEREKRKINKCRSGFFVFLALSRIVVSLKHSSPSVAISSCESEAKLMKKISSRI